MDKSQQPFLPLTGVPPICWNQLQTHELLLPILTTSSLLAFFFRSLKGIGDSFHPSKHSIRRPSSLPSVIAINTLSMSSPGVLPLGPDNKLVPRSPRTKSQSRYVLHSPILFGKSKSPLSHLSRIRGTSMANILSTLL